MALPELLEIYLVRFLFVNFQMWLQNLSFPATNCRTAEYCWVDDWL